jgi:Putative bacterial sensory transduction regulator
VGLGDRATVGPGYRGDRATVAAVSDRLSAHASQPIPGDRSVPMTTTRPLPVSRPGPFELEGWFGELGLLPEDRIDREDVSSWDLILDGRRRFDIRTTVILDPALAAIVWIHYAPPLGDSFRKSYRRLLRWNDEFPFVKFGVATDERPILTAEIPIDRLDRDELGLAIARLLAICDQLVEESAAWIWIDRKVPPAGDRVSRQVGLFARYADRLGELAVG